MNERIQELANQADLFVDFNGQLWPKALSADECVAAYKRFAELIIKECANTADCAEPYRSSDLILKKFGLN